MTRNSRPATLSRLSAWLLAAALLAPLAGWADQEEDTLVDETTDYEDMTAGYDEPLLIGVGEEIQRPLSLHEAVALGIQNNLQVEVERYAPVIAEYNADGAWGLYDPVLGFEAGWNKATDLNSNTILGEPALEVESDDQRARISTLVPYVGATIGFDIGGGQSVSNSAIQGLVPEYDASYSITTSIPLMRNLIWNEAWTNVKASEKRSEASQETFRASLMDVVQGIEDAYWGLVASREQLRVERKSLEESKALLEQTRTEYDVGVKSKVDVVEAEAGVAERAVNVIVAQNAYHSAQDALVDQVLGTQLRDTTNLLFLPIDRPEDFEHVQPNVRESVQTAMVKRPELQAARSEIERREIELKYAKNQRLPRLDVQASYGKEGLSGDCVVTPLGNSCANVPDGSRGRSYSDLFDDDGGPSYGARALFSIPIPNTRARKNARIADLELRRAKTQTARLEQQIILEVRDALRALESSYRALDAAERRRLAAQEQLRAEQVRLEHGESTPFDVLQRERDLVQAESQKIAALQNYRSSQVALQRRQGTLLDAHTIRIEEARDLR